MAKKTKQQAAQPVDKAMISPWECFVTFKSTAAGWASIGGTGCAHYVAHLLDIKKGLKSKVEVCDLGFTIKVPVLIQGLSVVNAKDVQPDDIWSNQMKTHCGIVTDVTPATVQGGLPKITISQCSSNEEAGRVGVNTQDWKTFFGGKGTFYRP